MILSQLQNNKKYFIFKSSEDGNFNATTCISDHITFTVDDLGATVTELKGKGIEFVLDPMQVEGGMKIATFKDPNGMLIELVEHSKP